MRSSSTRMYLRIEVTFLDITFGYNIPLRERGRFARRALKDDSAFDCFTCKTIHTSSSVC